MTKNFLVIDDHDAVLEGTCRTLEKHHPKAIIKTASSIRQANVLLKDLKPDLLITELALREKVDRPSRIENGIQFIHRLLVSHPNTSFVVYTARSLALVRLKLLIDEHPAGFTVADKSASLTAMTAKVEWALQGLIYMPPELRTSLKIKREWLLLIDWGFNKAMKDKEIAHQMNVSERTIRHYWSNLQDALAVYPSENINIRIQTYNRAREVGLID